MRTDGQTDTTKLTVAFFFLRVDAPKIFKIKLTVTHSRDPAQLEISVSDFNIGAALGPT